MPRFISPSDDDEPECYRVGVLTWVVPKTILLHWALGITTAKEGVYHLLHIVGTDREGYSLQFIRCWDRTSAAKADQQGSWYDIGEIACEYVYDIARDNPLGLPNVTDKPFSRDVFETTAGELAVPGVMPSHIRRNESSFPSPKAYLEWFTQDFREYPRSDAWVRMLVERLVMKEAFDPAALELLESIPRLSESLDSFLRKVLI